MRLQDKAVIVTGAAHGIGYACACEFAREGAKVMLADVNAEAGQRAAHRIAEDTGGQAAFTRCDVGDRSDVEALVAETVRPFGGVDVLVNNAGIIHGCDFLDLDEADFDRVLRVNLKGAFNFCKAAYRPMMKQRGGAIAPHHPRHLNGHHTVGGQHVFDRHAVLVDSRGAPPLRVELLRCHVGCGTDHDATPLAVWFQQLGDAKIHQIGCARLIEHDVARFNIPVDHVLRVGIMQRIADVTVHLGHFLYGGQRDILIIILIQTVAQ